MPNRVITKGQIGNALESVAPDHILGVANDIFDESLQMYQSEINQTQTTGGVYDISVANAVGGVPAKYNNLSSALAAIVSDAVKAGGMTVRFILSSNDKYVQYRLMLSEFTAVQFTNPANWQGVDDEPTANSENLVKSGGVFQELAKRSSIFDLMNTQVGDELPDYANKYLFTYADMPCHAVATSHDNQLYYIVCAHGSSSPYGMFYYLFIGAECVAKYSNSDVPDWVKALLPEYMVEELALGAVYDVSAHNNSATFASLQALLSNANIDTLIPTSVRKGGMSIKFIQNTPAKYTVVKTEGLTEQPTGTEIQSDPGIVSGTYEASQLSAFSTLPATLNSSLTYYLAVTETVDEQEVTTYTTWVIKYVQTSDNKYVQWRFLLSGSFTDAQFAIVEYWQGIDETPANKSHNLVESGGVVELTKLVSSEFNQKTIKWIRGAIPSDGSIPTPSTTGNFYFSVLDVISDKIITNCVTGGGYYAFVDSNNNVIGTPARIQELVAGGTTIAVPNNAKQIRITNAITLSPNPYILGAIGADKIALQEDVETLPDDIKRVEREIRFDNNLWKKDTYYKVDGTKGVFGNSETIELIIIDNKISTDAIVSHTGSYSMFTDDNGNIIGTPFVLNTGNTDYIDVPSGATRIRITNNYTLQPNPYVTGVVPAFSTYLQSMQNKNDIAEINKQYTFKKVFELQDDKYSDFTKGDYGLRNIGNLFTEGNYLLGKYISNPSTIDDLLNVNPTEEDKERNAISDLVVLPFDDIDNLYIDLTFKDDSHIPGCRLLMFDKDRNLLWDTSMDSYRTDLTTHREFHLRRENAQAFLRNTKYLILAIYWTGTPVISEFADYVFKHTYIGISPLYKKEKWASVHYPMTPIRFCAMGDSTMADHSLVGNYGDARVLSNLIRPRSFLNFARAGAPAYNHLKECCEKTPDDTMLVAVQYGWNDIVRDGKEAGDIDVIMAKTLEECSDAQTAPVLEIYRKCLETLKNRLDSNASIMVISPLPAEIDYYTENDHPSADTWEHYQAKQTQLRTFRDGLKVMCKTLGYNNGWYFVDGMDLGLNKDNMDVWSHLDGVPHPNKIGANLIGHKLYEHCPVFDFGYYDELTIYSSL